MTSVGFTLGLVFIWVLMWGSASPANVLSGLAVAVLLLAVLPGLHRRRRRWPTVRPMAVLRLVAYMLVNVVRSNVVLTREIVSRRSHLRTGVVRVRLPECSDGLVTTIVNLLALVPGTLPLEVADAPRAVYVHVLFLDDVEVVRRDVERLTVLAVQAFGSPQAIATLPPRLAALAHGGGRRTPSGGGP